MDYEFRQAIPADAEEVVILFRMAISHMVDNKIYQWDEIYPNVEVLSNDIRNKEMYLLIQNGQILACVVINEDQDEEYDTAPWRYREGRIAVIHRLCVSPAVQGAGIGRLTMQYAEGLIKDLGYSSIRLDTYSENHIARSLYEKLGYTYVGIVTFRKGIFYLLEKKL